MSRQPETEHVEEETRSELVEDLSTLREQIDKLEREVEELRRTENELQRAEEALKQKNNQLNTFINNIPDMAWLKDADSQFIVANQAFGDAAGTDPALLINQTCAVCFGKEEAVQFRENDLKVMKGKTQVRFEEKIVDPQGNEIWLETIKSPMFNEAGEVVGTVGVARDISERMRAEQERAKLEEQLLQAQKMEAIGRLAGGVAHDMNNILASVMGFASALAMDVQQDSPMAEEIENILSVCRKGSRLTRDLLGFARKGKYRREIIEINEVLKRINELLSRTISKKIKINISVDPKLNLVEGDLSQLENAIMNICINASDAIEGHGQLEMTSKNVRLSNFRGRGARTLPDGDYVEIKVSDTGVGMDSEILEHIFEPFFTTKPIGKGTGLGLSMAYGVIDRHGGAIDVKSEPGKGTIVTVFLPVTEGHLHQKRSRKGSSPPSSAEEKGGVLLVDDESLLVRSTSRLLEKMGYRVFVASNGVEALDVYQKSSDSIGLVLLDLIMPEMDGSETFRALKKINPKIRVLLFSGYSMDESVEELITEGAKGFLKKPFEAQTLASELKRLIG